MIASVIAKFNPEATDLSATIEQLKQHSDIEIGDLVGRHSLPMTLEATDADQLENLTRWIQTLTGVGFVDVVLVHWE